MSIISACQRDCRAALLPDMFSAYEEGKKRQKSAAETEETPEAETDAEGEIMADARGGRF